MSQPKVSIVIPTLSPKSKDYLDLCMASIQNLDYPKELLDVVISSPQGYAPAYWGQALTYEHSGQRDFAEAINLGVNWTDTSSKYILLLSDDVIMTRDSLKNMIQTLGDTDAIVNATSNCDNYWKYVLSFTFEKGGERMGVLSRYFKLDDVREVTTELMNAKSLYPSGALFTDTLCFYATLIPRTVWDKVGRLDEQFKTGYEDSDYCSRARNLGIPLYIQLDAIIWHFGGITSEEYLTKEMSDKNLELYTKKWVGSAK